MKRRSLKMLDPENDFQEKLANARWRVNFRRSLLDAEHGLGSSEAERQKREQQLLDDLEQAMRALDKLENEMP